MTRKIDECFNCGEVEVTFRPPWLDEGYCPGCFIGVCEEREGGLMEELDVIKALRQVAEKTLNKRPSSARKSK